ncbi:MAG: hypothetical protein K2G13_07135 [Muribaculaceae bacterium]|nr:hypothetical protein [Muribaculaceae bacterium]
MKKLLYLLLVLPFAMMISSCSNDNDFPNVDITIAFDNAAVQNGTVYAVEENGLQITGITTKAVDSNKESALVNIDYFWNRIPAPNLTFGSYPLELNLADMPLVEKGANTLDLYGKLLEVDKSIANFSVTIPIVVVASEEDLPDGLTLGQTSLTFTTAPKNK